MYLMSYSITFVLDSCRTRGCLEIYQYNLCSHLHNLIILFHLKNAKSKYLYMTVRIKLSVMPQGSESGIHQSLAYWYKSVSNMSCRIISHFPDPRCSYIYFFSKGCLFGHESWLDLIPGRFIFHISLTFDSYFFFCLVSSVHAFISSLFSKLFLSSVNMATADKSGLSQSFANLHVLHFLRASGTLIAHQSSRIIVGMLEWACIRCYWAVY